MTNESHTDLYPALQTAISKIEDQKREIQRLSGDREAQQELADAAMEELKWLREWCSRAAQVLPLVQRAAGTELQRFVSTLLKGEVPPSTGAPVWYPTPVEPPAQSR